MSTPPTTITPNGFYHHRQFVLMRAQSYTLDPHMQRTRGSSTLQHSQHKIALTQVQARWHINSVVVSYVWYVESALPSDTALKKRPHVWSPNIPYTRRIYSLQQMSVGQSINLSFGNTYLHSLALTFKPNWRGQTLGIHSFSVTQKTERLPREKQFKQRQPYWDAEKLKLSAKCSWVAVYEMVQTHLMRKVESGCFSWLWCEVPHRLHNGHTLHDWMWIFKWTANGPYIAHSFHMCGHICT